MRRSFLPVMGVAREGWLPLTAFAAAGLLMYGHGHVVAGDLVLALSAVLIGFFREPERTVPPAPLTVLAPVSGRVLSISEGPCSVLDRKALAVRIRVNPFGGYAMRSPVEGVLREPPRGSRGCAASWIHTDEGEDVAVRVACGLMFGQKPLGYGYGQRLGQGRRGGTRRGALEVELLIPAESRVEVRPGERVRSGESIIVHLPSRSV